MTLTRRQMLALSTAAAALPAFPTPARAPVATLTVAGAGYYDFARATLGLADRLILRREPDNPYDRNAIEILTLSGTKLGYVPRHAARDIAPLLDDGQDLLATVTGTVGGPSDSGIAHTGLTPGLPVITLTPRWG